MCPAYLGSIYPVAGLQDRDSLHDIMPNRTNVLPNTYALQDANGFLVGAESGCLSINGGRILHLQGASAHQSGKQEVQQRAADIKPGQQPPRKREPVKAGEAGQTCWTTGSYQTAA